MHDATIDGDALVYTRDASWFNTPNVSGVPRYHFDNGRGAPACNAKTALLDIESGCARAVEVVNGLRCRRSGCAQKWRNVPGLAFRLERAPSKTPKKAKRSP